MFVFMSSMKPSRGPFTAMAVCGSETARSVTFLVPSTSAPSTPSITSAGFPARISAAASSALSARLDSGKSSIFSASSGVFGAFSCAKGFAAS